jgi:hypothetical protein
MRGLVRSAIAVATVVAVGAVAAAAAASAPPPGSSAQVKALVAASSKIKVLPSGLTPSLATAASDNASTVYPEMKVGCGTPTQCVYGDTSSAKTLVLLGDSHAEMWLSAILPYAVAHQLKVVVLSTLGCPVASVLVWLSSPPGYYTACTTARSNDVATIVGMHPAAVVIAERTAHLKRSPTAYFTNAQWQAGLLKTLHALAPSGARLVVLGDNTVLNLSPLQCLAAYPTNVQHCSTKNPNPRTVNLTHVAAEKAAALQVHAAFVATVPWLCATTCSPVIGTMAAYWDAYHVTNTYATYLSKVMGTALTTALH